MVQGPTVRSASLGIPGRMARVVGCEAGDGRRGTDRLNLKEKRGDIEGSNTAATDIWAAAVSARLYDMRTIIRSALVGATISCLLATAFLLFLSHQFRAALTISPL